MNYINLLSIFLLVPLVGCMTTREYPRCYLFRAPTKKDIEYANKETEGMLKKTLQPEDFWIGKDVVVINASRETHRRIAEVWPEVGCINLRRPPPATGEIHDKWIVSRCQDYLEEILKRNNNQENVPRTYIAAKYPDFTCH